ncbi:MAG: AIR synthase related protein [bacterium]|nr:AIR synthase related protein [bacterium]
MHEYEIIRRIAGAFPRHPQQQNDLMICDAEIIRLGDELWALTMDEFSPEEDLFTGDDPETLGANLATATLSDLLAAGAEPAWYMHSMTLPRQADRIWLDKLAHGIGSVLAQTGCALCGGDLGTAGEWRYCGFAMGRITQEKPLTRIIPGAPQTLWVSGPFGDANIAALTRQPTPRFELRLETVRLVRETATACIDTSGGLFDAVWLLHELNPGLCLEVAIDRIPFASGTDTAARQSGIPVEACLLGGAGEYELLFAVPDNADNAVERALYDAGATAIGTVRSDAAAGLIITRHGRLLSRMSQPPPCPRGAADMDEYIREVIAATNMLFHAGREVDAG